MPLETYCQRPRILTSMSEKKNFFPCHFFFFYAPMVNKMQFWQRHREKPARGQNLIRQYPKNKNSFRATLFFFQNAVLTTPPEKFCQRPEILRQCPKNIKTFFRATLFFLYAPMVNKMDFRKRRRKNSANRSKKINFRTKVIWKIYIDFLKKILSPKCYLGLRWRKELWRPGQNFWPGGL